MGGRGNAAVRNTEPEKFEYKMSPDLKNWTDAEDKRSREMSQYVFDKIYASDTPGERGDFQEFYEENHVEELEKFEIPGQGILKDDEVTVDKMNIVYAQNWDENDRRVKQEKQLLVQLIIQFKQKMELLTKQTSHIRLRLTQYTLQSYM